MKTTKSLITVLTTVLGIFILLVLGCKKEEPNSDLGFSSMLIHPNFTVDDIAGRWSGKFDGYFTADEKSEMDLTFDKSGALTLSDGHLFGKKKQCRWHITNTNAIAMEFSSGGDMAVVTTSIPLTYKNGTLVLMNGGEFHKR